MSSHHDSIAVHDGVEAVGDGEHRAAAELGAQRHLDELVRPAAKQTFVSTGRLQIVQLKQNLLTAFMNAKI